MSIQCLSFVPFDENLSSFLGDGGLPPCFICGKDEWRKKAGYNQSPWISACNQAHKACLIAWQMLKIETLKGYTYDGSSMPSTRTASGSACITHKKAIDRIYPDDEELACLSSYTMHFPGWIKKIGSSPDEAALKTSLLEEMDENFSPENMEHPYNLKQNRFV